MPNVRELFPNLQKMRRSKRGTSPLLSWTKAPTFEQVVQKLATTVLDTNIKQIVSAGRANEMQRFILRKGPRFGYLCFKTSNVQLAACKSYDDLQVVFDYLDNSINWSGNKNNLLTYVTEHCTSPSYVAHLGNIIERF